MSGTKAAARMVRNRLVKDFNGNIIDWLDESRGGWIIRKREVVNHEEWQKELDKKEEIKRQQVELQRKLQEQRAQEAQEVQEVPVLQSDERITMLEESQKETSAKIDKILELLSK